MTEPSLKPPVRIPLIGPRPGQAGGHAIIDAEDEELVLALGPWYRADLLVGEDRKPAARNKMVVVGDPGTRLGVAAQLRDGNAGQAR